MPVVINRPKQLKRYKELGLDLRMRLTAKIIKGSEHSSHNAEKVESGGENEDLYEYLSSNAHDSLSYQTSPHIARKNQEERSLRYGVQALNEISITRGDQGMGSFEVYVNDVLLTVVQGDGILISTPTGSTAYNLSCGGSIVHIAAQVICLTPICPHSLSFRPIILPADQCHIKIKLCKQARQSSAKVTVDGQVNLSINSSEFLSIQQSDTKVPFLKWKSDKTDQVWSDKLNNQLKWNTAVIQQNNRLPLCQKKAKL